MLVSVCVSLPGQCFVWPGKLTGRVTDRQQRLPFATVLLLAPDSSVVKGGMTDTTGVFSFRAAMPGCYLLSASQVAYSRFVSPPIWVADKHILLPGILLRERAIQLGEVEVSTQKLPVEQHLDWLVVHVPGSAAAAGNTNIVLISAVGLGGIDQF